MQAVFQGLNGLKITVRKIQIFMHLSINRVNINGTNFKNLEQLFSLAEQLFSLAKQQFSLAEQQFSLAEQLKLQDFEIRTIDIHSNLSQRY